MTPEQAIDKLLSDMWEVVRVYDHHVTSGLLSISINRNRVMVASFALSEVKNPIHRNAALELAAVSWINGCAHGKML